MADVLIARVSYDVLITRVLITRVDCTVKPEITHTLGGHQILWVITGYGLSQV